MSIGGVQPVAEQIQPGSNTSWLVQLARTINQMLRGKLNATTTLTLRANQTTTTLTDSRIGPTSNLLLMPTTANAATALATTYVPTATILQGSAVIQHANTATTDRTFGVTIITG